MTEGAGAQVRGQVGTSPVSGPTPDAGAAMLRGSAVAAVASGLLVTLVSAAWGAAAATAAALGSLLAGVALTVGPLLLRATRNASPPAVTAAAAGGYAVVVVVLGAAFALLAPLAWLSEEHLAVALVVVTVAGLAGQVRAVTRLRVPVFAEPAPEQGTAARGGPGGDGAQSSPPTVR